MILFYVGIFTSKHTKNLVLTYNFRSLPTVDARTGKEKTLRMFEQEWRLEQGCFQPEQECLKMHWLFEEFTLH